MSGNPAHDTAALISEQLRQQEFGPDTVQNNSSYGPPALFRTPLTAAQVRQANINHYRRLFASAVANNVTPAPYVQALQSLGTSVYP